MALSWILLVYLCGSFGLRSTWEVGSRSTRPLPWVAHSPCRQPRLFTQNSLGTCSGGCLGSCTTPRYNQVNFGSVLSVFGSLGSTGRQGAQVTPGFATQTWPDFAYESCAGISRILGRLRSFALKHMISCQKTLFSVLAAALACFLTGYCLLLLLFGCHCDCSWSSLSIFLSFPLPRHSHHFLNHHHHHHTSTMTADHTCHHCLHPRRELPAHAQTHSQVNQGGGCRGGDRNPKPFPGMMTMMTTMMFLVRFWSFAAQVMVHCQVAVE